MTFDEWKVFHPMKHLSIIRVTILQVMDIHWNIDDKALSILEHYIVIRIPNETVLVQGLVKHFIGTMYVDVKRPQL